MFFYSEPLFFIIQVLYFDKFGNSFYKVRTESLMVLDLYIIDLYTMIYKCYESLN